jgi:surface polysaccharide O-acyltransferase-like enzyme
LDGAQKAAAKGHLKIQETSHQILLTIAPLATAKSLEKKGLQTKTAGLKYSPDFIHAIAILMVIFVHTSSFPYSIPGGPINATIVGNWFTSDIFGAIGYLGVPIFVMIGGALLLDREKADEPIRVFYKKRFNRIGVPLVFWSLIFFIWSYTVHKQPFTVFSIEQGVLTGSYPILWFLYLLVGLYLATPILRVLVKHIDRKKFTLLIVLWFIGTSITPLIHAFTDFNYNPLMFVFTDWVGYYFLGIYLVSSKLRPKIVYPLLAASLAVAILGDWFITATFGQAATGFFHGYLSFDMIIASAATFLILVSIPRTAIEKNNNILTRLMHWLGQNTLPLYLLHIIVLEAIQLGLLGFKFPYTGIILIDSPILFVMALTISSVIIYALKKVPYVGRIIG